MRRGSWRRNGGRNSSLSYRYSLFHTGGGGRGGGRLLEEKRREEQFAQLQVQSPSHCGGGGGVSSEWGRGCGSWRRNGGRNSSLSYRYSLLHTAGGGGSSEWGRVCGSWRRNGARSSSSSSRYRLLHTAAPSDIIT